MKGGDDRCREMIALLHKHGARFFEEAIAANPDGPIAMITIRDRCEVAYEVVIGDPGAGDHGRARTIWTAIVAFGASDAHCAGGAAFVAAGRAQDEVAFAALELMEARRSTDPIASITADTITDEQIREAYELAPHEIDIDTFDIALGRNTRAIVLDRGHAVTPLERSEARARCAEILNARREAKS